MNEEELKTITIEDIKQDVLSDDLLSPSRPAVAATKKEVAKKRGKGRPPRSEVEQYKKKNINNGKRGRPVGIAGRIEEFKARLLATGGDRIIDKIVSIALDDEHPGQVAALKMCMDRLLPMSYFDKKGGEGRGSIQINITGVNGDTTSISSGSDVVDAEDVDYRDEV